MEPIENSSLRKAIGLGGGIPAIAKTFGISEQAVHKWIKAGRPPAERVLDLERLAGCEVTRYELRPDVFGDAPAALLPRAAR